MILVLSDILKVVFNDIMGDAIAVGKRPTERCQTFKVQAVSLKREKIRKKREKKTKEEEKREEKKTNQALPKLQSASCLLRQRAPLSLNQS